MEVCPTLPGGEFHNRRTFPVRTLKPKTERAFAGFSEHQLDPNSKPRSRPRLLPGRHTRVASTVL